MTTASAHVFRLPPPRVEEAAARRTLREQIARLETELGAQVEMPRWRSFAEMVRASTAAGEGRVAVARPRLLSVGELEAERDRLVARLRDQRAALARVADRQDAARRLREEILRDPAAHPFVRVTNADVGEPGCHDWHVRPRFGLLGMLMRWWRVKVSSGCPLSKAPRPGTAPPAGGS
jgi:hypothetical protein